MKWTFDSIIFFTSYKNIIKFTRLHLILEPEKRKTDDEEAPTVRVGRRRAAAKAVGSLKEIPSNKKLRQGDTMFNNSFQYSTSINKDHRMASGVRESNAKTHPKTRTKADKRK